MKASLSPIRSDPENPYDVIVCGGGHAGCEAALAASRLGADTLLLSGNLDTLAQMSCNPAIGGQAKGQIVREIDALGGEMAVNTDRTGIQFRLLNASKGPAVQAPRAQCDKKAYQLRMKYILEQQPNLQLFQTLVNGLIYKQDAVAGVHTGLGVDFYGKTVIVTTGTFLRALLHVGSNRSEGGRMGDHTEKGLSGSFLEAGIELERLKTGTPPRILGNTIDFSNLEEQRGDENPVFFAYWDTRPDSAMFHVEQSEAGPVYWQPGENQVSCWITYTNAVTETIARDNLSRSALYGGEIKGTGPRYCPSFEDKIVRFPDKPRHMLFLEPEGRTTEEYYINGISTSLPFDVQLEMLRSIEGLEHVSLMRPAYAVEYDFAPPTQLQATLESKKVENLFFAGQINGTSGYEEAAGQGLVAAVNAVQKVRGGEPLIFSREESYIGVLIDDLVTKGTNEPYRMFTSRAEYRLLLNHHSAECRLLPHARRLGLLSMDRLRRVEQKVREIEDWVERLEKEKAPGGSCADAIRRGEEHFQEMMPWAFLTLSGGIREEVHYRIKYRGYLDRELRQIEKLKHIEKIRMPADLDYGNVRGLRSECVQKLQQIRPATLGQASRVSGVNPADISVLLVALETRRRQAASA